jgi:hypothetical protein
MVGNISDPWFDEVLKIRIGISRLRGTMGD